MSETPTPTFSAVGVLEPPAVRETDPAVTSARSSMWAAIVPPVEASRCTDDTDSGDTETAVPTTLAFAVRVAVRIAAPDPSVTVSSNPM